MLPRNRFRLSR